MRSQMFPKKSRVQVAIMLRLLLKAYSHWGQVGDWNSVFVPTSNQRLFNDVSLLLFTRLDNLIVACLFPQKALSYTWDERQFDRNVTEALKRVRGWKRKERNSNVRWN